MSHSRARSTLRLLFPQWQGRPAEAPRSRLPGLSVAQARTGLHLGAHLLQVLAPAPDVPCAEVPVSASTQGLELVGGIYAREVVLRQLRAAVEILEDRDPARVVVLGGDCSVSIAPFAHLARRYSGDLAVVWLDAHPDLTAPGDPSTGFAAMTLATLLGVGDAEITRTMGAFLDPARVLLVGLRAGDAEALARKDEMGVAALAPGDVRRDAGAVVAWLRGTGARRVAIHLDLDVLDPSEVDAGAAAVPGGIRFADLVRVIRGVAEEADVVGLTVAEHMPRTEILVRDLLAGLPLL